MQDACSTVVLGVPSFSILSRAPNLSRKPPKTLGEIAGFGKERWLT